MLYIFVEWEGSTWKVFFQDVMQFSQIQVELEMLVDGLTSPWAGEDGQKPKIFYIWIHLSVSSDILSIQSNCMTLPL